MYNFESLKTLQLLKFKHSHCTEFKLNRWGLTHRENVLVALHSSLHIFESFYLHFGANAHTSMHQAGSLLALRSGFTFVLKLATLVVALLKECAASLEIRLRMKPVLLPFRFPPSDLLSSLSYVPDGNALALPDRSRSSFC